jgi:hypothetical protein
MNSQKELGFGCRRLQSVPLGFNHLLQLARPIELVDLVKDVKYYPQQGG